MRTRPRNERWLWEKRKGESSEIIISGLPEMSRECSFGRESVFCRRADILNLAAEERRSKVA